MCIKSNYYENPYFDEGEIHDYEYLSKYFIDKNLVINQLVKYGYIISLEEWRSQQINRILPLNKGIIYDETYIRNYYRLDYSQNEYIIPLETWIEQQIDKILENE
jgi:hypothetical protein